MPASASSNHDASRSKLLSLGGMGVRLSPSEGFIDAMLSRPQGRKI